MTVLAKTIIRLCSMARSVPPAWRYDPVFRGSAIGAAVAITFFTLRVAGSLHTRVLIPGQGSPPSVSIGPTSVSAERNRPEQGVPAEVPRITPSRSLNGVTIIPMAPDRFGTAPAPHRN
jgi:hypothetical protein